MINKFQEAKLATQKTTALEPPPPRVPDGHVAAYFTEFEAQMIRRSLRDDAENENSLRYFDAALRRAAT